ncbi:hypothetical protein [Enterococcus entomosocium]|uniref:hypothetical protein n=1 Tax=Enterococcus entomosocium TaxID=3034352 RepID=UPI0026471FF4|nr:hypothetical protein [Enterococcus entomosocium]
MKKKHISFLLLLFVLFISGCSHGSGKDLSNDLGMDTEKFPNTIDQNLLNNENDGEILIFKDMNGFEAWMKNENSDVKTSYFQVGEVSNSMIFGAKKTKKSKLQAIYIDGILNTIANETDSDNVPNLDYTGLSYIIDLSNHSEKGDHIVHLINFNEENDKYIVNEVYTTKYKID